MTKKLVPFALLFTHLLPLVGCGSKTCTITFDPNNGEEPFTMIVNKGELLTEPESPEKTAYDFKAWRYNNIKWSFKYEKVKGDMILKAYYVPIEYDVEFVYNRGSIVSNISTYNIETTEEFASIKNPGYLLDGYIDQDGNKITTPKGNYGDKVLTPQWKLDTENFIEFGTAFDYIVVDDDLITKLDNAITSADFVGEFTFENNNYLRQKCDNRSFEFGNKYFPYGGYIYAKKVPATWLKIKQLEGNKTLYLSSKILSLYSEASYAGLSYKDHPVRTYLNNDFISEFFTDEEASRLVEMSIDNSEKVRSDDLVCENTLDKVFLLNHREMEEALPKLRSFFIDTYWSQPDVTLEYGFFTDGLSIKYHNFGASGFYYNGTGLRNAASDGKLYRHSMNNYFSDLKYYSTSSSISVMPAIVLENK